MKYLVPFSCSNVPVFDTEVINRKKETVILDIYRNTQ